MNKILITGGAGFIGLNVAKKLIQEGHEVTVVDNFFRGVKDKQLNFLLKESRLNLQEVNLLNRDAIEDLDKNFDYIYHFAAILGVAKVLKQPYAVLTDNVKMTANIIDFAHSQKDLKRFLFASTSEVYAGTLKNFDMAIPTPEITPLALTDLSQARTSYMLSKLYGEAMCHHSSLPFTTVRPHNVYGPRMGMAHVIPELLKKAYFSHEGGNLEVCSVNHKRTFCFIDDAVNMITLAAVARKGVRETFNVGTEEPEVTIGELAALINTIVGKRLTIIPLPETEGSPYRRAPKMSKVNNLLNYISSIGLVEGVKRTLEWYKVNVFNEEERP